MFLIIDGEKLDFDLDVLKEVLRPPSQQEISYAAKFVVCPFTRMEPPTFVAACVVFALLLRMAAGDTEAAAEFQLLAKGPSPWEELRG